MLLRDLRFELELSLAGMAEKVRAATGGATNANCIWRWENGVNIPNRREMVALYLLSGGRVTPNDFYDLPELPDRATEQQVAA